jgi:hypothetical protein
MTKEITVRKAGIQSIHQQNQRRLNNAARMAGVAPPTTPARTPKTGLEAMPEQIRQRMEVAGQLARRQARS